MDTRPVRRARQIALRVGIPILVLAVIAAGLLMATRAPGQATDTSSPAPATPAVMTELLGLGMPRALQGQTLQLIRYTLAPGGRTEAHTRPGIRVSFVAAGAYEFTLLSGRAEVWRAGVDRVRGQPTALTAGATYVFRPGDAIFLDEGVVSRASSLGPDSLVLWQAAIAPANQSTTTLVPATPAAASGRQPG